MISILYSNLDIRVKLLVFTALALSLIFAIVLHEVAHGYVALLNGDRTAKINRRLSLNPIRHFDPIGFSMLMLVGFGYAKPVPVNPLNFKRRRLGIFTVSIAGVSVNLVLAFIGCLFLTIIERSNGSGLAYAFFYWFFYFFVRFNLILCFFNLLPLFPLDGYNLLSSLMRPQNKFLRFLRLYSRYILIFLIALSVIVRYANVNVSWWSYLDILGQYLEFFAGAVKSAFMRFWNLFF